MLTKIGDSSILERREESKFRRQLVDSTMEVEKRVKEKVHFSTTKEILERI